MGLEVHCMSILPTERSVVIQLWQGKLGFAVNDSLKLHHQPIEMWLNITVYYVAGVQRHKWSTDSVKMMDLGNNIPKESFSCPWTTCLVCVCLSLYLPDCLVSALSLSLSLTLSATIYSISFCLSSFQPSFTPVLFSTVVHPMLQASLCCSEMSSGTLACILTGRDCGHTGCLPHSPIHHLSHRRSEGERWGRRGKEKERVSE